MKLLIHDLNEAQWSASGLISGNYWKIISPNKEMKHCIGCFGCWVTSPGQCILQDGHENMGSYLGHSKEIVVVSRCLYGGFSPFVKNVLDRSISYIHPYFVVRNNEMHHKNRYPNKFKVTVAYYGDSITDMEKDTAQKLVMANAINYDAKNVTILFFDNPEQVGEAL